MNFLNKPGIQNDIDSTKLDIRNNDLFSKLDYNNIKVKKNKFHYFILIVLLSFIAFSSYIFIYNYSYSNDIIISEVLDDFDDYNNLIINYSSVGVGFPRPTAR